MLRLHKRISSSQHRGNLNLQIPCWRKPTKNKQSQSLISVDVGVDLYQNVVASNGHTIHSSLLKNHVYLLLLSSLR
uniref:Uncharacterized protein n=1 Tax=Noccaea caerulescens TaxID=107243 RepID=A0A1J3DCK6_NOCCA